MQLSLEDLKALLGVLDEGGALEFEYKDEQQEIRVVMARGAPAVHAVGHPVLASMPAATAVPAPSATEEADAGLAFITSPFVGTFYRAPAPGAEPFVDLGSAVKPGQTLCIVEAMKLMNEIEAEVSGTVVEVYAQNGKPVEFGQKLFRIKKA
jgi:acetyl-CoA carboxylase biotin carboxyl carrier protein